MRKLLVSVLCVGMLASPVALAFAADENRENADDRSEHANYPALMDAELLTEARSQYDEASERAERKEDRRREAREAEQAPVSAEPSPGEETAPETTSSGATGAGGAGGSLASIRECESGGDYSTDSGNGFYGAYQFDQATWESVGGSGSPASASPAEQDQRAAQLQAQSGSSPWPVCGQ